MIKTIRISNTGPLLIIIAALLWAMDGVIRRYLYTLPPIKIIFFEHLFGLIILFPFVFKFLFETKLTKKEWWLLMLISLLSGLLGTLWFTTALLKINFISFSVVFLLQKLQPIFAILSARFFLKEQFNRKFLLWGPLAMVAAFFVTFKDGYINLSTGSGTITAALYALGAAVAWGLSTTFSKMLLGKVKSNVSTFYRFLFTVVLTLPILFIKIPDATAISLTLPQMGLFSLIAVSTGMVALLIYYKGLSTTPVHVATILELVFPFIAIFLDMFLYGNVLSLTQWVATLVLVFSIYKITQYSNEKTLKIAPA